MNKLLRHTLSLLTAAAAAISISSCNSLVHEDMDDCPEGIVIQLTPKYAARTSFEAEMSDVHIFIYDENNAQVSEIDVDGEQLAAQNYTVTANLPVGTYRLVVWNGLSDTTNYAESDAAVTLITPGNNTTNNVFQPLWHGAADEIVVENLALTYVTVPMVKDTNNFVIFLCTTNGDTLNPEEFDFTITCADGSLAQDNSVLSGPTITYTDFVCREDEIEGSVAAELAPTDDLGMLHLVRAELNTSRLVTSRAAYLQITQKSNSRNIIKINLLDYILKAFRSDKADSTISNQTYLDTEDLFNLTFFLTPRTGRDTTDPTIYVCSTFMINQWILRLQEMTFSNDDETH